MKIHYTSFVIFMSFIVLNFWSCEEEPESIDCTPLASAISDALAGFTGDGSEENCVTYKAALQAAIDGGCDADSAYLAEINNYDCDCVGLEADILVASTDFISNVTTTNCTTYKTTLQSAVDGSCDPSGAYQETINTLGDCSDPSASIDCVNLISGVVTGSQNYSTNPSNETCNAYKDSLMVVILGGCDTDSTFQITFDSLDCESDIISAGDIEAAIALVEEANAELEDIFSELYDSDEPDDIDGFLDLLDFSEAYSQYAEAQYLDPNNDDANFGVALTGLMQVIQDQAFKDMIDRWDNYFTNTTLFEVDTSNARILGRRGFGLPLNREGMRVPISPFVGAPLSMARMTLDDVPQFSELQDIVHNVFLPYVDSGIAALATVENNSDYIFSLTSDMQPDVDASSLEFDLTEVYAIDMMLHAIKAICNTVIAYNFDFATHDGAGIVAELNQNSDFAALNSSGAADLSTAYSAMNSAIDKLDEAIDFLEAESDDQDNDMIQQMENSSDYEEIRDGIDMARDVLNQPTWVSYYTYEEGEDEYGYWYEDEIEDSMQVDIQQFFSNPIEDMKDMVPPYTITAGIDTSYDYHWDEFDRNVSVTLLADSQDINNDWSYYFNIAYDYYNDTLHIYEYGPVPQALADSVLAIYEDVMEEYSEFEYLYVSTWYNGPAGDISVEIRVEYEWGEMEGMFNYPVITWDADTFDEWENGWPDPTFNGIFPTWTSGGEMMEFLGMDEEGWQKTWD